MLIMAVAFTSSNTKRETHKARVTQQRFPRRKKTDNHNIDFKKKPGNVIPAKCDGMGVAQLFRVLPPIREC